MSFEEWMDELNEMTMNEMGLSVWSLENDSLRDWFDRDMSPEAAFDIIYADWLKEGE